MDKAIRLALLGVADERADERVGGQFAMHLVRDGHEGATAENAKS